MLAHGQVEQLVAVEAVDGRGVDEQVKEQLDARERADEPPGYREPVRQLRVTLSFSTQTFVAKNRRIMAA